MADGEMDLFSQEDFCGTNEVDDLPSRFFMGDFFDELLKDTHACTHIHTCNHPGPDKEHSHTCFHTHTKLVQASGMEKLVDNSESLQQSSSKSKPPLLGNREAVKKYREKKKARTACLEKELLYLTAVNQKLMKKLERQSSLEAEVARLRCLLADFRGRIDVELGSYPYQRQWGDKQGDAFLQPQPGQYILNSCNAPCNVDVPCLHPTSKSKSACESSVKWHAAISKCQNLEVDVEISDGLAGRSECTLTSVRPNVIPGSGRQDV